MSHISIESLGRSRGLLVAALFCFVPAARSPADEPPPAADVARALSDAFRHAFAVIRPSVVTIRTVGKRDWADPADAAAGGGGPGDASGLVVEGSGGVLTSYHAVADADAIFVGLPDGREVPATEVRLDPRSDLALVRFRGGGDLPEARWADPGDVEVGDWVLAAGNAFGLGITANPGTLSDEGRAVAGSRVPLLQTNAPSNPGNSGGPVVNMKGQVVGVSEGAFSAEGGSAGIALAIPADTARFVAAELRDHGRVRWPYLGLGFETAKPDVLAALRQPAGLKGAMVTGVAAGAPAARAGLLVGDVVTRCGGRPVGDAPALLAAIQGAAVGEPLPVEAVRNGRAVRREVRPELLPNSETPTATTAPPPDSPDRAEAEGRFTDAELGVTVADLPDDPKDLTDGVSGVLVTAVTPGSPAQYLGVHPGGVVTHVGSDAVPDVESFKQRSLARPAGAGAVLLVRCPVCGDHFLALRPELARPLSRLGAGEGGAE